MAILTGMEVQPETDADWDFGEGTRAMEEHDPYFYDSWPLIWSEFQEQGFRDRKRITEETSWNILFLRRGTQASITTHLLRIYQKQWYLCACVPKNARLRL